MFSEVPARAAMLGMRPGTSGSSSSRMDEVEQKYDVVMNFPNLELHSAAAEGNVGLVHYALTHGQPVNSVLHGVQPIHAAAAGGSESAIKMLIDRGADVNAPRLPRRYSNEKKRGAPSLGAAGATPLHFAAANGHANIVQILLTCGAAPEKTDKLGQTAESLAEANGHDEVLRVLQVYDHLQRQDSGMLDSASIHSGSQRAGPSSARNSPDPSGRAEVESLNAAVMSLKGKERATSPVSHRSDKGIVKLRKSLDGLFGRRARKNSAVPDLDRVQTTSPPPPLPPIKLLVDESPQEPAESQEGLELNPPDVDALGEADEEADTAIEAAEDSPHNPLERQRTPDELPFPPSRASSVHQSSVSPESQSNLQLPQNDRPALAINTIGSAPLAEASRSSHSLSRITSAGSQTSYISGRSSNLSLHSSSSHLAPPPREHRTSHSSRRPSLPSILEKAVHPGQAFRQALRKEHQQNESVRFSPETSPIDREAPRAVSGNSFFHRGRLRSNESALSSGSSNGSQTLSGAQEKARRHMTRNAFIGLFRRSHSPPSRSPSPPASRDTRPIDAQELEEGIERLKRASLEMDRQEGREEVSERMPKSAPVTRTRFFEDLSPNPPPIPEGLLYGVRSPSPPTAPPTERIPGRPRKGSEVIAPSPLANEWARESSDSDTTAPAGVRRARTDGSREHGASKLSQVTSRGTKPRSATLPSAGYAPGPPGRTGSGSRLVSLALDDGADLRSGVLRRESAKKGEVPDEEELETTEDDEEVFHDARQAPDEVIEVEEELPSPPRKANRYRGASIGSMTSQSSRISTPSGSNVRFGSAISDDGSSDRRRYLAESKFNTPAPASVTGETRPRGKSVSSIATTTSGSGMGFSYNQSTPATSLTPPSTLSITLGSAFPPVPEYDIAGLNPYGSLQRRFSSREEAAKAIRQQEDDVLQLAQLPANEHSSRDLAAQLAAYGDSHAMEQELVEYERQERKARREARRSNSAVNTITRKGKFEIDDGTESTGSAASRSESFVSAQSGPSGSVASSARRESDSSSLSFNRPPPSLLSVEAPKTSVPNINSIYDRRANMYRAKMQALTSTQTLKPPSVHKSDHRRHRALTAVEGRPLGPPAWLTSAGGPSREGRTEISASLPMGSLPVQPPGQGLMAGANAPKVRHRERKVGSVPRSAAGGLSRSPPPPIADILSQRYQGLSPPSSYTPRASNPLHSPPPLPSVSASRSTPRPSSSSTAPSQPSSLAPPASIFSHRFAGPHDGGESDDSEHEAAGGYTMIENDWRGGRVLGPGDLGPEGLGRRGKWGFKGPFGKRGR